MLSKSALHIYNTATKKLVEFSSIERGVVKIYVCGPTVQSEPHIGHMRSAVAFDIVRRYLESLGYTVKFIQNVTDIDDKILNKSALANVHWKEHANKYENEFFDCYRLLGILSPTKTPHASEYIPQQIKMIEKIIDNGYAYQGSAGNVWFNTSAWKEYGELTNQTDSSDLEVSEEDYNSEKINPRDFALWKSPHKNDPDDASWDSPWGKGRPGWHIECSAMSCEILGGSFDIHGGGLDLRFPHHENEIAQSRSAGYKFANIWMHSAWVTAKGEKMSKSLGNGLNVYEVIKKNPLYSFALRYSLSNVHYRSMIEWSNETLESSLRATERLFRAISVNGAKYSDELVNAVDISLFPEFKKCMDDDFNVSGALASIWTGIKNGVPILYLRKALQILGIDPLSNHWRPILESRISHKNQEECFTKEQINQIEEMIAQRAKAKQKKDYQTADRIRDSLLKMDIELVDTKDETKWQMICK